jgi:DeoR family transcriptional regulator, fructose operon transcriptional repressor
MVLTEERQRIVLSLLRQSGTVKLQELVEHLQASESTIRRDLIQLEELRLLKRVHGGAALPQRKGLEPTVLEKQNKQVAEKQRIAKAASSFIENDDCIYLDAGTTTMEMIPYLKDRNVTVLTNGLMHIAKLMEYGIKTLLIGGQIKVSTNAIVGSTAVEFLKNYRFDKCFLGMNGVHSGLGFTTPDPDEAILKKTALQLSEESYVLADSSKLNEATFTRVADLAAATIITDDLDGCTLDQLREHPGVKVVTA